MLKGEALMPTPRNSDPKKQRNDSGRPEVNEGDVDEQVKREEERQVIDNPGAL